MQCQWLSLRLPVPVRLPVHVLAATGSVVKLYVTTLAYYYYTTVVYTHPTTGNRSDLYNTSVHPMGGP